MEKEEFLRKYKENPKQFLNEIIAEGLYVLYKNGLENAVAADTLMNYAMYLLKNISSE